MKRSIFNIIFLFAFSALVAQDYPYPDISYLSQDSLISIRDFHYAKELSNNINKNIIYFKIIHEGVHKNTYIKKFHIEFSVSPNLKIYDKKALNGNESFAGYNPDIYASIENNKQKIVFDIPVPIDHHNPRYIWFHLVPYLNGTGKITAKFKYIDSNGKTKEETIYNNQIISKAPDVIWFLEKKGKGKYLLSGKMKYNYDFQAYAPEKNNKYKLTINGKKINSRIIKRKGKFDYLVANGTIVHEEDGIKTEWKLKNTKLYIGKQGILPDKQNKPKTRSCTQIYVNALKENKSVKISWVPYESNSKYEIFRNNVSLKNKSGAFTYSKPIGITSNNNFEDTMFNSLPDTNYYIYSVKKEGENIYNLSLPVFKYNPLSPQPVFYFKYLKFELGWGYNNINCKFTNMLFLEGTVSQIKFNNYFSINPFNLRAQIDFTSNYGFSLYSLIMISKGKINYEFGGGIIFLNSENNTFKHGPEIEGGISTNYLFRKPFWNNIGFHLFGRYSLQYQKSNYSGLFFGINYFIN